MLFSTFSHLLCSSSFFSSFHFDGLGRAPLGFFEVWAIEAIVFFSSFFFLNIVLDLSKGWIRLKNQSFWATSRTGQGFWAKISSGQSQKPEFGIFGPGWAILMALNYYLYGLHTSQYWKIYSPNSRTFSWTDSFLVFKNWMKIEKEEN